MKKRLFSPILILIFLLAGCSQEQPAQRIDLSKREKVILREDENIITYAYLPQYSHTVSYHRHHLLVEYLRKETGLNVKQIFPDTFNEHIKMVGQGRIDISYSNPFIYIKIANTYGARAFSRVVEMNNRKNFRGQIICRSDNRSIKSIADCRGKRWIAVDRTSAGGYLYALGHFYEQGLTESDFSEIAFSPGPGGKQEKVVLAVYAGKYDIGTIREGTLNVVSDKIDINEIRVVANSRWYPGWVYAARKDLSSEMVEKIKQALLKLNYSTKEHRKILQTARIMGVISSVDQDFNPVRKLAANLGMGF